MNKAIDWNAQFQSIDALLTRTRQYWKILPFSYLVLPWQDNPALVDALNHLDMNQLDELDASDQQLRQFLSSFINEELDIIDDLSLIDTQVMAVDSHFHAGIKGRKWQQIQQFEALLPNRYSHYLEWCSGKGHLGRLIAKHRDAEVLSLEWQHVLCEQGKSLATKHEVNQVFQQTDVLDDKVEHHLLPQQHAVALHACGDLHSRLLKHGVKKQLAAFSIVPCCFHLIQSSQYHALSECAQKSKLTLSKQDLSLSMQQTVVAAQREQRHRHTELVWRLGFDVLQRQLLGNDSYLPIPSIKQSMLTTDFTTFCHWACERKGLVLPSDIDLSEIEQHGQQRLIINRRIEIVTHAFRQLLERWLLLDRVLFLQENGYQVSLYNFCKTSVTPRNAMIQAVRISQ